VEFVALSLFWMVSDVILQLKLPDNKKPGTDICLGFSPNICKG